jgi:Holliday junction resolvase RusA-like endonuclease
MSAKFKAFHEQVYWEAKSQYKAPIIEGNIEVGIIAYFHDKRHCDCSNLPKGCLDALQKVVYKNDSQVKYLTISVIEDAPADHFEILIKEL